MKHINLGCHLHNKRCDNFLICDSNIQLWFDRSILEIILAVENKFEVIWSISLEITDMRTFESLMFNSFYNVKTHFLVALVF